jgi:hypothetical protein
MKCLGVGLPDTGNPIPTGATGDIINLVPIGTKYDDDKTGHEFQQITKI